MSPFTYFIGAFILSVYVAARYEMKPAEGRPTPSEYLLEGPFWCIVFWPVYVPIYLFFSLAILGGRYIAHKLKPKER